MGSESDIFAILGMLIIFAAVLFVAWLTTKLLGKKLAGTSKNKNMKIVETLQIGMDRCLYLIRVGNKYFLFHASRKSLEMVSEIVLDSEAIENQEENGKTTNVFDFKRIFESYSGLTKREKISENKETTIKSDEADDAVKKPASTLLSNIGKLQKITRNKE